MATTQWRVILCDKYGNVLSNISRVAFGKQLSVGLNRPSMFTFWCPSNAPEVASLDETCTVRVYRKETNADYTTSWNQKFAGHIWVLEDDGDPETVKTAVTCFDPFQVLALRVARRMIWCSGPVKNGDTALFLPAIYSGDEDTFTFPLYDDTATDSGLESNLEAGIRKSVDPGQSDKTHNPSTIKQLQETFIARGLLNCTNWYDGFTGLDDYYASATFNANGPGSTLPHGGVGTGISPKFDTSKKVGDQILDIFSQVETADFEVVPVDNQYTTLPAPVGHATDYAGFVAAGGIRANTYRTLGLLKYHTPSRGTTQPNVVFAYGAAPHNIASVSMVIDRTNLINHAFMIGKGITARATNITSLNTYGITSFGVPSSGLKIDITDQTELNNIAVAEANDLAFAQQTLSITPVAGANCPLPWDDFDVGDYIIIVMGAAMRGGYTRIQRVFGYTMDIGDDNSIETLSSLIVSPQDTSGALVA